jgi:hypothetical protein
VWEGKDYDHRGGPADGYCVYEIACSAEGATFTSKPGAAPQGYEMKKNSAESAIHFRRTSWDQRQLNRAFSACLHGDLNSWGAAPGLLLR